MTVPGLTLLPGYISPAEEAALLSAIDAAPWDTSLKRRVQHYGWRYDYRARTVAADSRIGDLPDWLASLAKQLTDEQHLSVPPDQVIVNEYLPGQGISAHVDCVPCFEGPIASLSLGTAAEMIFQRKGAPDRKTLILPPRALLILDGSARYDWTHEIPARQSDLIDGTRIKRQRRISLTFRKVRQRPQTPL